MSCRCIICPDCVNGRVWVTLEGTRHKYRCDDMGDTDICLCCDGAGIIGEQCDCCSEADFYDDCDA